MEGFEEKPASKFGSCHESLFFVFLSPFTLFFIFSSALGPRNALYKSDIIIIIITSYYHSETRLLLASVDIAVCELQAMMTQHMEGCLISEGNILPLCMEGEGKGGRGKGEGYGVEMGLGLSIRPPP